MSNLHVWSTSCSWHGPIENVGSLPSVSGCSIPCCPHCGSVLLQDDEGKWWEGALIHEQQGHTNYEKFLRWTMEQKRCWPTLKDAGKAYTAQTGSALVLRK